jgi:hypothetical protein
LHHALSTLIAALQAQGREEEAAPLQQEERALAEALARMRATA